MFFSLKQQPTKLQGARVVADIEVGKSTWDDLFEKTDFFSRYKYYIEVIVKAESEKNFNKWYAEKAHSYHNLAHFLTSKTTGEGLQSQGCVV